MIQIITKDNKRYIKTEKDTELPLMSIKGKDYLQVAHRLVWFREVHPDWQIVTEIQELNYEKKYAVFRAAIKTKEGELIATATKAESIAGFTDYIEKAETGAIGRALANTGFGTQFAPELDEEDRLADSPVNPTRKDNTWQTTSKQAEPGSTTTAASA